MSGADAGARWLTEADVAELVELDDAIAAVRAALVASASGPVDSTAGSLTMDKTAVTWGEVHTLHALGGVLEDVGIVGTKTWAHTAGGAEPLLVAWDAATGRLRAVIEAFALGQLRTAAVSAVAIDELATPDASVMAMIGTGKQALAQVAAAAAVRPVDTLRVFSPTPAHREEFAERVASAGFAGAVEVCDDVASAACDAAIVTVATRSRAPIVFAYNVAPHAVVNALGAITPGRAELAHDLVAAAGIIVSDSPPAARSLSDELAGVADEAIVPLAQLVVGDGHRSWPPRPRVFKAMGLGLADVAVAGEVISRAAAAGRGSELAPRVRATPRLFTPKGTS